MNNAFDAVDFALYLRSRWRVAAICCATAVVLAAGAGSLLPRRYTATATLIIQPPASSDPRAALAVSPVYLESLKTYENFATSDTLFLHALEELRLRANYPNSSVEALKRRVLTVNKPTATRIIEISATLNDPLQAKRLAQFIAEQTVAKNQSLGAHASDEAVAQAEANAHNAETRLAAAVKASVAGSGTVTVEALSNDFKNTSDLKYEIQRELARSRTELADLTAQRNSFVAGDEKAEWNSRETAATTARIRELEDQEKQLVVAVTEKAALLERARPGRDSLDAEQRLARTDVENTRARLSELRASLAFRGERLEVLDPGIVPERPSYPNIPLMVLVAFAVALLASLAFLAAMYGYSRALAARSLPEQAERLYQMR